MQKFGKTTRLLHVGKCEGRNVAYLGLWGDLPDWQVDRLATVRGRHDWKASPSSPNASSIAVTLFSSAHPERVPVRVAVGDHEALGLGSRKDFRAGRASDVGNLNILSLLASCAWLDIVVRHLSTTSDDNAMSCCESQSAEGMMGQSLNSGVRYAKTNGSAGIYVCRSCQQIWQFFEMFFT